MDTIPAPAESLMPPPERSPKLVPTPRQAKRKSPSLAVTIALVLVALSLLAFTAWHVTRSEALAVALAAEAREDFPTALRTALDHLDRLPWSRQAALVAARCLSRLDYAEAAEPYYRKAGKLSLEDLHYRAYGLVRANLRERAIQAYKQILMQFPGDVTALRTQAGVLLSQSRFTDVKPLAAQLIDAPNTAANTYAPVVKAGRWTLKAAPVASPSTIGYTLDGVVNHDTEEFEAAAAAFEKVVKLDPDLHSMPLDPILFWSHLGFDLLQVGRSEDVIRYLTKAAEGRLDPGLMDLLGQAYAQQSSFEDAERCWRQALAWDPNHFGATLNLGRFELRRDRPQEALVLLNRAAALKPEAYEPVYSLSLAYRRLGRVDEAKKYQQKAAEFRRKQAPRTGGMGAPPSPTQPKPLEK